MQEDARKLAIKYALKNAHDYGKAEAGAVLGKLLASNPELRGEMAKLSALVAEAVAEVNGMTHDELQHKYSAYAKEFEAEAAAKAEAGSRARVEVEGAVQGKFATRFAPEPNGYMQIGHAKVCWLGRELADRYKGTLALYFDDTNPEKEKQEYVDAIKKDIEWLGVRFDREYYASDNLPTMYNYAEELIRGNNAYVCTCDTERMKKLRFEGGECEHREQDSGKNLELWKGMLEGRLEENGAVLRLKFDMKSANTAMRDPVAFRIMTHKHYRQGSKYRVWPTYDFNTPVMDSLQGITDAMRSKEYELRNESYARVLELLKLRKPEIRSVARLEITGNITSKRKTNALIEEGRLQGYDDPRLVTIAGLRRRGIRPEAIKSFVLRFGMSKTDSSVSIDMLLAENRSIVDDSAKRLFAVVEPVKLSVEGIGDDTRVELKLHPSKGLGTRECRASGELLISGSDAGKLKEGDRFRLKDLVNVEVTKAGKNGIGARAIGNEALDAPKFQWVDAKQNVKCKLIEIGPLMVGDEFNDGSLQEKEAHAEEYVNVLGKDEVVQFERIGFYKLDEVREKRFIGL